MKYFGGFGFSDDILLFGDFMREFGLKLGIYDVAGFSYGAQLASVYAMESKKRINNLILFSPAFFDDDNDFKNAQIEAFKRNPKLYMRIFYKNTGLSSELEKYLKTPQLSELEALLYFKFDANLLQAIKNKGINISIFLGECDKIINAGAAFEHFSKFGSAYLIKYYNHLLRRI